MRRSIEILAFILTLNSCIAQGLKKGELSLCIEKKINTIEFSKLSFFARELIELGADTSFLSKFKKEVEIYDKINRKTAGDRKEYELTLSLLYNNIRHENVMDAGQRKSQEGLLKLLNNGKQLNFSVNEDLILQQIDDKKRGMINGYDEGSIDESMFIFFCYDPVLYKRTLIKNGKAGDWKRMGVFLCNYLRENGNPVAIRNMIRQKIIIRIDKKEVQNEFGDIISDIKDCDITTNLFD